MYKSVSSFIVLAQQEHCFPEGDGFHPPTPGHRKPKKARLKYGYIVYAVFRSHVYYFISEHVFESEFASGIKDVIYMLRMAVLNRIHGWFYYVFKR